jgi:hypothetical protein
MNKGRNKADDLSYERRSNVMFCSMAYRIYNTIRRPKKAFSCYKSFPYSAAIRAIPERMELDFLVMA